MKYATGCNYFNDKFPERFYDVGIAEAHAATFAAGLASQGKTPVFAVYSTFSQRGFDRFLHDIAIQKLHVVLAIDRAGIVGEDGETHQGLFDVAMLSMIPGVTVYSPSSADELGSCLRKALYEDSGLVAVRYPRGSASETTLLDDEDCRIFKKNSNRLIITYGRLTEKAHETGFDVLQLVKITPIPSDAVNAAMKYGNIEFWEEGIARGSVAEAFLAELVRRGWRRGKSRYRVRAVRDFVPASTALDVVEFLR
jgi:1-deoxy-D-xylulose-5-phosphate synthase